MARDERANGIGRLRPFPEPVFDSLLCRPSTIAGFDARVVVPEDFHEAAVARGARIGHHDTEEGTLLRARPA